ncbi:MAG: hypothetical protein A3E01_02755 [Gammaproteobacteria bacterium RIFCSPHIGHO2_12_FULL_63_22]|nr:MAG: hypothetical protein A3E01_02755 [Gammaproteobacteria bacterium RIFCSPHIGHO2_12_FULL_63_22]
MEFRKHILNAGTYRAPKRTIRITPERIRHWCEQFDRMSQAGLQIPVPWGHVNSTPRTPDEEEFWSSKYNAGFVKSLKTDEAGRLLAELEIPLEEDARRVGTVVREVSPEICDRFRDGSGNVWEDVITHVALVNMPVAAGQENFEPAGTPLVASAGTDGADLMHLSLGMAVTTDQLAFRFVGPRSGKSRVVGSKSQIPKGVLASGKFEEIKGVGVRSTEKKATEKKAVKAADKQDKAKAAKKRSASAKKAAESRKAGMKSAKTTGLASPGPYQSVDKKKAKQQGKANIAAAKTKRKSRMSLYEVTRMATDTDEEVLDDVQDVEIPDTDAVEEGADDEPEETGMADLLAKLAKHGFMLPEDATLEELPDLLMVALDTKEAVEAQADGEEEEDEDDMADMDSADMNVEQPNAEEQIAMSLKANPLMKSVYNRLEKTEKARISRDIDELVSSGRISPALANEFLKPQATSYRMSLNANGETVPQDVDRLIEFAKKLPAGACWEPGERATKMSLRAVDHPNEFKDHDGSGKLSQEEIDAAVKRLI